MATAEELYNRLGQWLAQSAPPDWASAWVSARVSEDHAKADYDYRAKSGKEAWFDPGMGINGQIAMALIELRSIMITGGQPAWSKIVFRVEQDGKFKIELGYEQ